MDSTRNNNNGFASNSMFADSNQFNAYDNLNLFQNGAESDFNDASWGVNASDFPNPNPNQNQSRGQQSTSTWQQNANHLSAQPTNAGFGGQASPYGRPMNQSTTPYTQNAFYNYGAQSSFPYGQQQYDPSLGSQPGNNGQNFGVGLHGFNSPAPNSRTITPQALNHGASSSGFPGNPYAGNGYQSNYPHAAPHQPPSAATHMPTVNATALAASIPRGAESGMFSIIDLNTLSQATNSDQAGSFVNVGRQPLDFNYARSAVPTYHPRRSRNDLRVLASHNPTALAKIGKRSMKNLNNVKPLLKSDVSGTQRAQQMQDSTSSDESSSDDDDDDSSYTDDDDDADSPLPSKRPDDLKGGMEYDATKALWRNKRKSLDSDTIRQALVDFWELTKTVRDRWKADSTAYAEAKEKKRTGELPLLESRVKDGRDMIEIAFRAALKNGHRDIVTLLSENMSLMYLCYQFLLDRYKADDPNGSLSRAILETMSTFTTLTKAKMEKVNLEKVLPRFQKAANAKTAHWVKQILINSEAATKEATSKETSKESAKSTPTPSDGSSNTVPGKKLGTEPVAGVKRPAATTPGDGNAAKKPAIGAAKPAVSTAASRLNGVVKKPISAATGTPTVKKAVAPVNKSSGFFSNLQSAPKKEGTSIADKPKVLSTKSTATRAGGTGSAAPKPAFSFAETMASLTKPKEEKPKPKPEKEAPPETPEQRAKRLRKEQRRKLHVQFKPADELVSIRYFTHDPDEEIGHDSSQMRDVADVGGEGRMLKQHHQHMDVDEEDDGADEPESLKEYKSPTPVDFSTVDKEERKRNYKPYGGGELEPVSEERAKRDAYEGSRLIVFYSERSQIPPNPKEPADPYNGDVGEAIKYFGAPEEKYAARARAQRGASYQSQSRYGAQAYYNQGMASQPSASAGPDISSILATLQQQPQQAAPFMGQPFTGAQAQQPPPPPLPSQGNIDLAAILAAIQPGQQQMDYGGTSTNFAPQPQMFGSGGQYGNEGGSKKSGSEHVTRGYRTKPCQFWQQGTCTKGDKCTYKHE